MSLARSYQPLLFLHCLAQSPLFLSLKGWSSAKLQIVSIYTCLFFIAGELAVQERSPGASLILSGPGIQVHFFPPESEPILMEYINNLNGIADFSP